MGGGRARRDLNALNLDASANLIHFSIKRTPYPCLSVADAVAWVACADAWSLPRQPCFLSVADAVAGCCMC